MIELKSIIKKYGKKTILNEVDLQISEGDYISIIGDSGAGKSTLMNIIGTLDSDYSGEYYFKGERLQKRFINDFRNRHIGFIFQQYNLIPNLSVYENVFVPYVYHKNKIIDIHSRANGLLEKFNLYSNRNQIINTLSGGEQQRIALIRSVLLDPQIIIADEPTGNLDEKNSKIIHDFLQLQNDNNKTIIVVTHDLKFAEQSKKTYIIKDGYLYEQ